jgi:hypothetical protein
MTVPNENSVQPTSHAIPRDEPQSRSSLRPSLSLTNEVLCLAKTPRGPNFMGVTSYTTPVYVIDFTRAL